jgi:XTP/dITP diphosphohydrolase
LTRLYCATGNAGKLREFRLAAGAAPVEIELLPGFQDMPACVEDGATFEENAIIKARHYARLAGPDTVGQALRPAFFLFADDSGLEVDALGGAPGVLSARYCGHHGDDLANNRLLIERLRGVANRTARFVCAIALVEGGELRGVYRGAVEGLIVDEPRGDGGFGYDPHFFYPPFGRTFGEAGAEEKFAVSHRGQALRAMLEELSRRIPAPVT